MIQNVGSFTLLNEIGKGSFATVYLGRNPTTGEYAAIKSVQRSKLNRKLQENLDIEISILKNTNHPHIIQLFQKTKLEIHLIMEYASMGDLSIFIRKRGEIISQTSACCITLSGVWGGLDEIAVRYFLGQLGKLQLIPASSLEFLRSQSLIHRDLKPQENILLVPPKVKDWVLRLSELSTDDVNFTKHLPILKLADFGFARALIAESMASTICGSPLYMAPEILKGDRYDAKSDLWSIGAILFEMLTSKPPFRAQNHIELLRRIERGDGRIRFPGEAIDEGTNREFHGLMRQQSAPRRNPLGFATPPTHIPSHVGSLGSSPKFSQMQTTNFRPFPEDLKDLIRRLLKRNPVERISFEEFFMLQVVLSSRKFETKLSSSPADITNPSTSTSSPGNINRVQSLKKSLLGSTVINAQERLMEPPFPMYGFTDLTLDNIKIPNLDLTHLPSSSYAPIPPRSDVVIENSLNSIGTSFGSFEFSEDGSATSSRKAKVLLKCSDEFIVVTDHKSVNLPNNFTQPLEVPGCRVSEAMKYKEPTSSPIKFTIYDSAVNDVAPQIIRQVQKRPPLIQKIDRTPIFLPLTFISNLSDSELDNPEIKILIISCARAHVLQELATNELSHPESIFCSLLHVLGMYQLCIYDAKIISESLACSVYQIVAWINCQFKIVLLLADTLNCKSATNTSAVIYSLAIQVSKYAAHLELLKDPNSRLHYQKGVLLLEIVAECEGVSLSDIEKIEGVIKGIMQRLS